MVYHRDLLARRFGHGCSHRTDEAPLEVRAGYGECTMCTCKAFVGGTNDENCGRCGCPKDVHRY